MHMGNIPFILLKGLMMKTELTCPKCGAIVEKYLNPKPTVDIVIHDRERGLVLVDRKNPPYGNALPGGFIDLGESAEQAAVREAFEETNLRVRLTGLLGVLIEGDLAPPPLKEGDAHLLLQPGDAGAQIGLGDEQGLGGLGHIAQLGYGDEVSQL